MKRMTANLLVVLAFLIAATSISAQTDDICREFGTIPSFDSPFSHVPYIFGKVSLRDFDPASKFPRVTVTLVDSQQTPKRQTIEKSGNYCFRRSSGNGSIVVDLDGVEVARRTFNSFNAAQQREDFEIRPLKTANAVPGVISAKFSRPPNEKTLDLYRRAAEAEKIFLSKVSGHPETKKFEKFINENP